MGWRLAASVLSADFARLGEQVRQLAATGLVDRIQVDVMDGMFVPNISFGPLVFEALGRVCDLPLEAHLMVEQPSRYFDRFAEAGAHSIIVHWEACLHLHRDLETIRGLGLRAGVAINPATPVELLSVVLPLMDTALVMTVDPGFGGRTFIPAMLDKVRTLRQQVEARHLPTEIEVDGGVNVTTARLVIEAGANVLVAGSALFPANGSIAEAVQALAQAAGSPPEVTDWT